jgi:transposase
LKWLRRSYRSDEVLHVVLDNAGYHLKAEVLDYAAKHRIKFYWTPTNASWLNRIESHFTALRKFALDNTDHRSHEEQQEAIESYLSWRNHTCDISLEDWKSYRRAQKKVA